MSSLRSRRRRATEREIAETALALFEATGVQESNVQEIARRAEVSERTFFRYFARKEDAVLVAHTQLNKALRDAIETLQFDDDPFTQVRRAYMRVIAELDNDESQVPALLLRVDRLMQSEPLLKQAGLRLDDEHCQWLTQVLSIHPSIDVLQARLFAEELGVLFRHTMRWWTEQKSTTTSRTVLESMHDINAAWSRVRERTEAHRDEPSL